MIVTVSSLTKKTRTPIDTDRAHTNGRSWENECNNGQLIIAVGRVCT